MFQRLATRPVLIGAAATAIAVLVGWFLGQDAAFRWAATPPGSFARERAPAPPDYADAASWALRPDAPTAGAWETPWGVDVFFVHPTSAYAGDTWNAAIDDAASARKLDLLLANHAAPFRHAGPVYAPRYRQASLHAELNVGSQGDGALKLAYDDVLRAFDHYMERDNQGRAVVLAGVGQGGVHALRLLRDRFQTPPLNERLAAAYIIDAVVPADLGELGVAQAVCAGPDSIQCVAAWSAPAPAMRATIRQSAALWSADGEIIKAGNTPLACVNPLSWRPTQDLAPTSDHRGAVRARPDDSGADELETLAGTVSARCLDGLLDVDRSGAANGLVNRGWGASYKTAEYNLFYADIAHNAAERSRAASVWLDENARKPAKPLPPAMVLPDAPIHRPNGVADPVR